MHRFTIPFIRIHLVLLTLGLTACSGGSGGACPAGFVAMDGVCLPAPDAGMGDADMPDGGLDDGAMDDGAMDDADVLGPNTYYADIDMDGFGDPDTSVEAGEAPAGFVEDATDCDDGDAEVHPGATEVCDGADDNCDGSVDEGVTTTYYADADTDGFGEASATMDACSAPSGFVEDDTDCDDTAMAVHPGATEVCDGADDDCNGSVDDGLSAPSCALTAGVCAGASQICGAAAGWAACVGTASYGASYEDGAETRCDHLDNDCDGTVDEGTRTQFYADCDGDGARDVSVGRGACDAAEALAYFTSHGHPGCTAALPASAPEDCDDGRASVRPGATEVCNGRDDNCDGSVDEGVKTRFYRDRDRDAHGDSADSGVLACTAPAARPATNHDDCDDMSASVHPGATEVCNGIDDNCNGVSDDGLTFRDYYADRDGDGFGDPGAVVANACSMVAGTVTDNTDCADQDANAHPGQTRYFTTAITGPRTGTTGSHDYNCDGTQTKEYTGFGQCSVGSLIRTGWTGATIASCGVNASYAIRDPFNVLGCRNSTQTQACR